MTDQNTAPNEAPAADPEQGVVPDYVPDFIREKFMELFPDPWKRQLLLEGPVKFFGNQSLGGVLREQRWTLVDAWLRAIESAR